MVNFIKGLFSSAVLILNTVFWTSLLFVAALFDRLSITQKWKNFWNRIMVSSAESWIACNSIYVRSFSRIHLRLKGRKGLRPDKSYLILANHQSWVDITLLQMALNRRIPFMRFFLKEQLLYVPFLGLAWKALNFPFMKRYSKEFLAKHPELRGADLEETKKACEQFRGKKVSIINFVEGTRFTRAKHKLQNSPYAKLLRPKSGGVAFTLESLGNQFDAILDVTIHYPEGPVTMWDFLCGRLHKAQVFIRQIPIPREMIEGRYLVDEVHRKKFQAWIEQIWKEKDLQLRTLSASAPVTT